MSNFAFLNPGWTNFWDDAREAERMALRAPRTTAFYCRRALELGVHWVFENDASTREPYDKNLKALLHESTFRNLLPVGLWEHIRYIWKLGNQAVHEHRKVTPQESVEALRSLYNFLAWLTSSYTAGGIQVPSFDIAHIPNPAKLKELREAKVAETLQQVQMLEARLRERDEAKTEAEVQLAHSTEAIAALKAEIEQIKAANAVRVQNFHFSESESRVHLIDPLLRESGWDPDAASVREFEVSGMPNESGKGWIDYVLWGKDGLPLAVIEAKRTQHDPNAGKHQAKLYADCLEQSYGRRPLVYFTNGYKTWFWDDTVYPPRAVSGFHTQDELQLNINRRTTKGDITKAGVNRAIVGRPYQELAIKKLAERYQTEHGRGALLVMATGTGKTRVSIAAVEMLMKQNWVRRVLFLADRLALLTQAEREFKKHLPDVSRAVVMEGEAADSARIVFSTYPSMMNAIDDLRSNGTRRFSPGHFDLIVIDEAHRSVYQKYGEIFRYFDALLLGLTATPKSEVDFNTYSLFGLEDHVPTHVYELEDAVDHKFLVPPKAYSHSLKFLREGIKYDELSEAEKQEYEEKFGSGEEDLPEEIAPEALNAWLFNRDTVDKVLETLMLHGIKVEGGDRLGKTIIFAKNHKHAEFMVERFNTGYPHLRGHYCTVIDNKVSYAQDLIDNFSLSDKQPTIAVSVDMMDTGIDVPDVVNLVFFKMLRSRTKFWQMVGRGTRLRPDLFGPGEDKTHFVIFDYCGNLEFFSLNPKGVEGKAAKSVKEHIFLFRLDLFETTHAIGELEGYRKELLDSLHAQVASLNLDSFLVRPYRETVEPLQSRDRWDRLTEQDATALRGQVAALPTRDRDDEFARRFDLLMLRLQLSILRKSKDLEGLVQRVKELAQDLSEKNAIPVVNAELPLLLELKGDEFWLDVTLPTLEQVRRRIRDLVKFADAQRGRRTVYTNLQDEFGGFSEHFIVGSDPSLTAYREKVRHSLRHHLNHPSVRKLRENVPVSPEDVAAIEALLFEETAVGPEKLPQIVGDEGPLTLFVRRTVGLDPQAARQAFSELFESASLTATQLEFLEQLIQFITVNGVIEPVTLFGPPFTDLHDHGVDGVLPDQTERILRIVEQIKRNASIQ